MKALLRFFAERYLLANLLTLVIILLGLNSLRQIKRDATPDVDAGKLVITTRYPGAAPEDVELNVTNKLEDELKNVDGVDLMTSYSLENISVINITLDPDASDPEKIKRDIWDAVGRVTDLPQEVTDAPYIKEVTTENVEIIRVGMGGELPYAELAELAKHFEGKLKDIEGVSRVQKTGYLAREVKVEVSQDAMEEYQISLQEIVRAIQMRNVRATGGSFESYTSEKSIVTLAQFRDPIEVGNVIVRSTFEGPQILVKDLAIVRDGFEPEKTRFRMNGQSVIGFTIFKKGSADLIRVVEAVKDLVERERNGMPAGVELMYSSDKSGHVRSLLSVMTNNALLGLVLVVLVLFIFLNFRTAFWVAMGIPLTIFGVFFLAPLFGASINTLTLIGLIIVIGLIVDDAIIVAENISYRREKGDSPLAAAVNGTYEVLLPVFVTIVTTVLAFAPFFFMSGQIGQFIWSFPLIVVLALLVSFGEVTTILPAHITAGKGYQSQSERGNMRNWFEAVRSRFRRVVVYVLRFRYLVIALFVIMLIAAFWYADNFMKFVLVPRNTSDAFYVVVELETGTSLRATSDKVKLIEQRIAELPREELESFWTLVGSQGQFAPGESENWALTAVTLTPYNERERSAEQVVEELRRQTDAALGPDRVRYVIETGGPPVGSPITLRVVGSQDKVRTALADSVEAFLSNMKGVTDIDRDDKLGKEQVEIIPNYLRLSRLGLTVADLAQTVRLAYDGEVVTRVRYGDEDVGFRVILEENARKKPDYLGEIKIPNERRRLIPLSEVAQFKIGPGPASFYHYAGRRTATITADLAEGSTLTPLGATNKVIDHFDLSADWPGMRFAVGGEAQETQESMVSLAIAMAMAAVGIYLVLVLLFNSLTQPVLVMLAIPFGLIGIIGAFALHEEPLGFMAMLGVIGMMGVVVNDSLILINHINGIRKAEPEKNVLQIVSQATTDRLRPILLTSITTVAALLPTVYSLAGYNFFIAPMAMALGYGILFATPLTLFLLPSLYLARNDVGNLIKRILGSKNYYVIPGKAELAEAD